MYTKIIDRTLNGARNERGDAGLLHPFRVRNDCSKSEPVVYASLQPPVILWQPYRLQKIAHYWRG
jgi:hypothetical protein